MAEIDVQNEIRIALNDYAVLFDTSIGATIKRKDMFIRTGLIKGHSDLTGVRKKDGRAVFIEVKDGNKGVASKEQVNFIKQMKKCNAIAGICRDVDEALELVKNG